MNRCELRKFQLAQIEMLEVIDQICSELSIDYYIVSGTLLGAVRHKGFIPWDSDIDIAMRRDDYEKLREFWENNNNGRYFYQHYATEKDHLAPHAILRINGTHIITNMVSERFKPLHDGIYLDIFPLDNAPAGKKQQTIQNMKRELINRILFFKVGWVYDDTGKLKLLLKRIMRSILSPISLHYLHRKLDDVMQKYNGCESEYIVSLGSPYSYWKVLMPASFFKKPNRIMFEGRIYSAPTQINEYLKAEYGDYLKLPPENERYMAFDSITHIDYGSDEMQAACHC